MSWPVATIVIILVVLAFLVYAGFTDRRFRMRKAQITADQEEALRHLVRRYEQLAESSLDAQQRAAADVSELLTRTAAIEQILRTVD